MSIFKQVLLLVWILSKACAFSHSNVSLEDFISVTNPCYNSSSCSCTGQSTCDRCPKGSIPNLARTSCEPCQPGTYNPSSGNPVCFACLAGTVSDWNASTCTDCPPGSYQSGFMCNWCDVGRFSSLSRQTSCELCLEGTFADEMNQTRCSYCEAGLIPNSNRGADGCDPVPAGYFSFDGVVKMSKEEVVMWNCRR